MANSGGGRNTPSPVGGEYYKQQLPAQSKSKEREEHALVLINPLLKPRLYWDVILSILFFYNATVIPIYICYGIGESIYDPVFWINRFVDLCFFVDIVLCFETGIYAGELIIMKRQEVRQIYLKTWFLHDIISTIPYDLIAFLVIYSASPVQNYVGHSSLTILNRLTLIELLKLIRLVRFLKTNNLFNIFEKALVFRYEDLAKIKFTLFVFFCLHWSACIFSWLDENVCENDPDYSVFYASGLSDRGNGARYLASFYWALATMVTIGYGDISARCSATRLFSLIIMFMASAVYAYGLSYVMDVIRKNRKQQEEFRELMDMANRYMDFRGIPHDLREELRKFFNFKSESEAKRNDLLSERLILNELSPELRFAVLRHVNSGLLDKVPFFQEIGEVTKDSDILQEVVLHLQSQVFRPNEVVIKEGDLSDELFFITKGTCMLVKWGTITTKVLPEGSYHGETGFLSKTVSFRASKRFSTLPTKLILTEQLSNEPSLPSSLKRQATERSVHNSSFTSKQMAAITSAITSAGATPGATPGGGSVNNHSDSFSEDEYLQSHTFLTQTFADLRYITRGMKLEKVYRIMSRRYEVFVAAELAEEKELMEKFPEAYEEYMFDDATSSSDSEDDWRRNENDVLDDEIKIGPEGISGHGGGLLRRVLSRNLSQGSIKGGGSAPVAHLKHSPRAAKLSPLPPGVIPLRGVLKTRFNYDSPRKASAPAVLSPSQQAILSSKSSTPTRPQRATMTMVEEIEEEKRSSPRQSFIGFTTHPQEPLPSTRHRRGTGEFHHQSPSALASPATDRTEWSPGEEKQWQQHQQEHGQHRSRRATPRYADQEVERRKTRVSRRTSLSSLAEMGIVAPTPDKPMRYHNVIPARASLFMRQRSKHLSRDDIGTEAAAGGGAPLSPEHPHRKSHRSSVSTHQRRRSLLSKRSQGGSGIVELKTFSEDTVSGTGGEGEGKGGRGRRWTETGTERVIEEGEKEDENVKQLVTEIDGLMSQLTSIKRRLSHTSQGVAPGSASPSSTTTGASAVITARASAQNSWRDQRAFSAVSEEGNLPTTSTEVDIDMDVPILVTLPSMRSMVSAPSSRRIATAASASPDKDDLSNLSVDGYLDGNGDYCSTGSSHDVLSLTSMPPKSPFLPIPKL